MIWMLIFWMKTSNIYYTINCMIVNVCLILSLYRRSALHCAAYAGSVECCTILVDVGANINQPDDEGLTPLHWACSVGHIECVLFLIDVAGAYHTPRDFTEQSLTPLDYAILSDYQDLSQLLIERGALTIASIQDLAAIMIQKIVRGFLVRQNVKKSKKEKGQTTEKKRSPEPTVPSESKAVSEASTELSSTANRRR